MWKGFFSLLTKFIDVSVFIKWIQMKTNKQKKDCQSCHHSEIAPGKIASQNMFVAIIIALYFRK